MSKIQLKIIKQGKKLNTKLRIQSLLKSNWVYPIFLIIIGLISYVISFPKLGFYWDDWQAVFLYQNYDVNMLREYFFYDRPFSSWTYEIIFPFLPMNPIAWQMYTMILRVLAIWFLVSAFIKIWGDKRELFYWVGALLLVFPSFTMQSISVAFNQHFFTFLLFCASIYLMVIWVFSTSKIRFLFYILSLLSMVLHIFTMEYFIGLEVIRPIILFFAINQRFSNIPLKKKILLTVKYYVIFFLIIIVFVIWRIQIYPNLINDPLLLDDPNNPIYLELIFKDPIRNIINLVNLILQDSTYLLTQSWLKALEPLSIRIDAVFYLFSIIIGLGLSLLFFIYSTNICKNQITNKNPTPLRIFVLIGSISLLFGGLSVWITDRQLLEGKWSDRFSLAPMLGVVILILIAIEWLIAKNKKKFILIFVLGLAIAFQMRTTHSYALDWQKQLDYYWQLYWRVPAVKPGTAFFSSKLPSNSSSRFSIGFFLNTLYSQDASKSDISYWYFSNGDEGKYFSTLQKDNEISYKFRNLKFSGSTSNSIAFMHKPESGCLLVFDEAYVGYPDIDPFHMALFPVSNLNQIDSFRIPVIPNRNVFGDEPSHGWCYYFEKADLARQTQHWDDVLQIINEAHQLGFSPQSGVERMPELEAYFYKEDWESFLEVSKSIYAKNEDLDEFLCVQWKRLDETSNKSYPPNVLEEMNFTINCP